MACVQTLPIIFIAVHLSGPQCSHLENRNNVILCLTRLLRGESGIVCLRYLALDDWEPLFSKAVVDHYSYS